MCTFHMKQQIWKEKKLCSLSPFMKNENFSVFSLQAFSFREFHILTFSLGQLFFPPMENCVEIFRAKLLELINLGEWNYII